MVYGCANGSCATVKVFFKKMAKPKAPPKKSPEDLPPALPDAGASQNKAPNAAAPPAPPAKSRLWGTLTSIRFTVFLLLILAAVAVIGTILPQDQPVGQYLQGYGEVAGAFLYRSGLTAIYYSPWFLAPITLLAVNITACLINGLPQAIRRSLRPLTVEAAAALPERGQLSWPAAVDPHSLVAAALRQELGRPRRETFQDREVYFFQTGRFRPVGPYLIHLSLLLILAGGLIGKFWGLEGRMSLLEGEQAGAFLSSSRTPHNLDFEVRLDRFQVEFYEKGSAPKEFRSDLTIFKDGREVARAVCRVNEPVTVEGYTFYQSSYGAQATGPVRLNLRRGDQVHSLEAPLRRWVEAPGGAGRIMVVRIDGNLQGNGPAVQLAYRHGAEHPNVFWLTQDHPEAGEPVGPYRLTVAALPFKWYSVFQVKRDPGVWWVYAGFILILPGFFLAFFRPAQRWAVVLEQAPQGGWKGRLLGAGPRSRDLFEARQNRIMEMLKKGTLS